MDRDILLCGHLIDEKILPKVLDAIEKGGGSFRILSVKIGQRRDLPSEARIRVESSDRGKLDAILEEVASLGGEILPCPEAMLEAAPADGVLPDRFYVTTNLPTEVFLDGKWRPVAGEEMDLAIVVDRDSHAGRGVPMADVRKGELVVVGEEGVRVTSSPEGEKEKTFRFMSSEVSVEKPKGPLLKQVVARIRQVKKGGGKILWVAGPTTVHNGAAPFLEQLVKDGWVDVLFAGNALAVHDIEHALLGTSLGVPIRGGESVPSGHAHHLWAINTIRGAGSIAGAVASGLLREGVMHACIACDVPFVLAGSIRDDGPLPDVITDAIEAQKTMRNLLPGVEMAIMVGTTLHSVATGNLLPARVFTVCVDINPAVVTKLRDRGTRQSVGIVMDAASFLKRLAAGLAAEEGKEGRREDGDD